MIKELKVIIFDLDDTLISEQEFIQSGFLEVSKKIKHDFENISLDIYSELIKLFRINSENVFDRFFLSNNITISNQYINELVELYRNHYPKIDTYSDVKPTLLRLKEKEYKLGLITDGYSASQQNKIKATNLKDFFDYIIITDNLAPNKKFWKPHPISYKMMKEFFDVTYSEMIYIGDNEDKDFISPKQLGMKYIKIERPNRIYLQSYKKIKVIHSLKDLFK